MTDRSKARRGYVPDDGRNFSPEGILLMRTASRHISYLINEGYDLRQTTTFVGNHFLLSERQRLAVMRSLATSEQLADRERKRIEAPELSGREVWVDGFNTIITLEVLCCDSILLDCMDGTVRDLAALRGTYRIIPETKDAVRMLLDVMQENGVRSATILLDEPVSNSGRLKTLIAGIGVQYDFQLDILIRREVDRALYGKENVVTSDSIILDRCAGWVNLTALCMKRQGKRGIRVWEENQDERSDLHE